MKPGDESLYQLVRQNIGMRNMLLPTVKLIRITKTFEKIALSEVGFDF